MKHLLFTLLLVVQFNMMGQNEITHREPFKLQIAVNEEHFYAMDVERTPYFVKDNILQIYPGESLFIKTEVVDGSVKSMKVVAKNTHPEKTITVEFSVDDKDKKKISTFLTVKNPFNKKLIYKALMFTPISQKWKPTSIIPVRANLMSYEHWPHPIITLVLEGWELQ